MGYLKQAADNNETAGLLETIRAETPAYWPEGLSVQHFKQGNLWTIHEKQGNAVGFVGWQERREDFEKVGYYSIGVLPEYRRRGIAKEAVSQLLRLKAASVDRVKAFIRAGNEPSEALARDLGVQVKQAALPLNWIGRAMAGGRLGLVGMPVAGGLTNALVYDVGFMPKEEGVSFLDSRPRMISALLNFGTGVLGTRNLGGMRKAVTKGQPGYLAPKSVGYMSPSAIAKLNKGKAGWAAAEFGVLPIAKVLLGQRGMELEQRGRHHAEDIAMQAKLLAATAKDKVVDAASGMSTPALLGAAGVVAAALGAAGYGITKALNRQAEVVPNMKITQQQGGRLKVTLPTKNPGDAETMLDLPYDQDVNLSNALRQHLAVDTRRRIRAEVNQRRRGKGITAPNSIETASVRA
jgi:GNAT superfamily N-acetyltransferase